jgi:hypothetical protein
MILCGRLPGPTGLRIQSRKADNCTKPPCPRAAAFPYPEFDEDQSYIEAIAGRAIFILAEQNSTVEPRMSGAAPPAVSGATVASLSLCRPLQRDKRRLESCRILL